MATLCIFSAIFKNNRNRSLKHLILVLGSQAHSVGMAFVGGLGISRGSFFNPGVSLARLLYVMNSKLTYEYAFYLFLGL